MAYSKLFMIVLLKSESEDPRSKRATPKLSANILRSTAVHICLIQTRAITHLSDALGTEDQVRRFRGNLVPR